MNRTKSLPLLVAMLAAFALAAITSALMAPEVGASDRGNEYWRYMIALGLPMGCLVLSFIMKVESIPADMPQLTPGDAAWGPDLTAQSIFINGSLLLTRLQTQSIPVFQVAMDGCRAEMPVTCPDCAGLLTSICSLIFSRPEFTGRAAIGLVLLLFGVVWIPVHGRLLRSQIKGDRTRVVISVFPSAILLCLSAYSWFM